MGLVAVDMSDLIVALSSATVGVFGTLLGVGYTQFFSKRNAASEQRKKAVDDLMDIFGVIFNPFTIDLTQTDENAEAHTKIERLKAAWAERATIFDSLQDEPTGKALTNIIVAYLDQLQDYHEAASSFSEQERGSEKRFEAQRQRWDTISEERSKARRRAKALLNEFIKRGPL